MSLKNKNILIGSIMHETISFQNKKADLEDFKNSLVFDNDILKKYYKTDTEIWGFINNLNANNINIIPSVANLLTTGGKVTSRAYEYLKNELFKRIKSYKFLDGILLALHGCMITENDEDGEGKLLKEIRELVGIDTYIVCTLDFHAQVTPEMVKFADILVGYDTAPHHDIYETGKRASGLMLHLIKNKKPLEKIHICLPMMLHCDAMVTDNKPLKSIMNEVIRVREYDGILSSSLFAGFPLSDKKNAGPGVLITAEDNKKLAQSQCLKIAEEFWKQKENFIIKHIPIGEAIERAEKTNEGPVIFLDAADNISAGAPGDNTYILKALIERNVKNTVLALIRDPEAVQIASNAGIGKEIGLNLGGKYDDVFSKPLKVKAIVTNYSKGKFIYKGKMMHGVEADMGRTAVLKIKDIDVIVTEFPSLVHDPELLRSLGIEPKNKKIIVLKDGIHFRNEYGKMAKDIIFIKSPGYSSVDYSKLNFKNVKRPVYPLDDIINLNNYLINKY